MVITYVGKEKADIIYQLIRIGGRMRKKILVYDNSITHDLFVMFEKRNELDQVQVDNMTIVKDYATYQGETDYEYVFYYEGLYPCSGVIPDMAIIAPGYELQEWNLVRPEANLCRQNSVPVTLLMRDKANNKVTNRMVAEYIGIQPVEEYELSYDEKDYSSYVCMTHNKDARVSISGDMYSVIIDLAKQIYQIDNVKKIKRLIR